MTGGAEDEDSYEAKLQANKIESQYTVERIIVYRLRGDLYRYISEMTSGFE